MGNQHPWRNEEWCREQYLRKDKSIIEIANDFDASTGTIHKWLNNHGIDTSKNHVELPEDHEVNNPNKLKQMHHERDMSVNEIAQELDVSRSVVKTRFERFDIQRNYHHNRKPGREFFTDSQGYERLCNVRHHRILACRDNDPNLVFSGENVEVHHENGVTWDNRPENLEVLTQSEHVYEHWEERYDEQPWHDEHELRELYHEEDMSTTEIGEMFGVTGAAIYYWVDKHDL